MFSKFIKTEKWSTETLSAFFDKLNDYFNEDKCLYSVKVANELVKKGDYNSFRNAEAILINAIRNYFDVEDSNYKAKVYYSLGHLYEVWEEYIKSYTYYEKYALNNTSEEGANSILLKIIILRDNFTYSDNLEKHLLRAYGEYNLGLRNNRVYEMIAEYLIFINENKFEKAEEKKKDLKSLIKYGQLPLLDLIIKKDNFLDTVDVPKKVVDFVENL